MTPVISIIVAVYKAESCLRRCVDSLLAQTFQDYEILLVDDGSPDRSGEICDEYARKDNRVRVFHKENGGVASARQCGMNNARGEYVIHADPDDWVEPNMLEELYGKAKEENADIVVKSIDFKEIEKISKIKNEEKNYIFVISNANYNFFELEILAGLIDLCIIPEFAYEKKPYIKYLIDILANDSKDILVAPRKYLFKV